MPSELVVVVADPEKDAASLHRISQGMLFMLRC
jgi:hypothetical protein